MSVRRSAVLVVLAVLTVAGPAAAADVSASSVTGLRLERPTPARGAEDDVLGISTVNAAPGGGASAWVLTCRAPTIRFGPKCLEIDPDVVISAVPCPRTDTSIEGFLSRLDMVRVVCPRLAPGVRMDLDDSDLFILDRDPTAPRPATGRLVDVTVLPVTPFISSDPVTMVAPTTTRPYHVELSELSRPTGFWSVTLAGGDDVVRLPSTATGGSDIRTRAGEDVVATGGGSDVVDLGSGDDRLVVAAVPDGRPDSYTGGSGTDTLDFSARTTPVVAAGFTSSVGGTGDGDDRAVGFERVIGGSGNDSILGMPSAFGGPGDDLLTARAAGSLLVGGPGVDTMRGGPGDDRIDARDGARDARIECGGGQDVVELDLVDPAPAQPRACRSVARLAIDEGPPTRITGATARTGGVLRVRVACPAGAPRACAGFLTAALADGGSRTPARVRYRLRAGRTGVVAARLTPREATRLTRTRDIAVTSRETGRSGPKTVRALLRVAPAGDARR